VLPVRARSGDHGGLAVVPWSAELDEVRLAVQRLLGLRAPTVAGSPRGDMGAHLTDSVLDGHRWAAPQLRARFEDRGRVAAWLDILAALAEARRWGRERRAAADLAATRPVQAAHRLAADPPR
jgi:hypothetical protein